MRYMFFILKEESVYKARERSPDPNSLKATLDKDSTYQPILHYTNRQAEATADELQY
jgi:hypothetical protein